MQEGISNLFQSYPYIFQKTVDSRAILCYTLVRSILELIQLWPNPTQYCQVRSFLRNWTSFKERKEEHA